MQDDQGGEEQGMEQSAAATKPRGMGEARTTNTSNTEEEIAGSAGEPRCGQLEAQE